jgi:FKBP-type peptidyl-prolyl cis-trans isomerase (trigger factor)
MSKSEQKSYQKVKLTNLPNREAEITGSISTETMATMRSKAIAKIKETAELDGFRKGNVPDHLIVSKIGEMKILEEAAEIALNKAYPEILQDEKIDAIGRPNITITKIAPGIDLEFTITTALAPEITIADYTKIAQTVYAKKPEPIDISEKEIDEVIRDLRKNVAHNRLHANGVDADDHSHGEIKDEDLPEVDAPFLKEIGGFPSVEDLRAKIQENMSREKEAKAKDKQRTDILEEIITQSKIEIPQLIIDAELEKMLGQFKDDIDRAGVNYDEYLAHIKKSEDDMKKEWQGTAEKRAKSQIALATIAREKNIAPEETAIKKEMEKIIGHHKNLDRFRVRMFVENFLTNELVFQSLEKNKITGI